MKRLVLLIMLVLLLAGCTPAGSFEQLQDVYAPEETPEPAKICLTLPADATAQTLTGSTGRLYFCEGYELIVETLAGGDLDRTLLILTGCEREDLTLLETGSGSEKRWETVWSAVGEGTQQVGRLLIVDDGNYHYCVSVMADALDAGALQESWESLFGSVVLSQ
jgi:hypothetical protein